MTNLQLLLSIGIPSVLLLVGFLNNHVRFNHIESRLGSIESDLRQFYATQGRHEKSIELLEKRSGLS